MTKPSDFILNSDYLSIAQTGRSSHTATFGGGTLQPAGYVGDYVVQHVDFTITSELGAIDRIMISDNGSDYYVGSQMSVAPSANVVGFLNVYRVSKNVIRAELVLTNNANTTSTYPTIIFRIKITSFKPPNVL